MATNTAPVTRGSEIGGPNPTITYDYEQCRYVVEYRGVPTDAAKDERRELIDEARRGWLAGRSDPGVFNTIHRGQLEATGDKAPQTLTAGEKVEKQTQLAEMRAEWVAGRSDPAMFDELHRGQLEAVALSEAELAELAAEEEEEAPDGD